MKIDERKLADRLELVDVDESTHEAVAEIKTGTRVRYRIQRSHGENNKFDILKAVPGAWRPVAERVSTYNDAVHIAKRYAACEIY